MSVKNFVAAIESKELVAKDTYKMTFSLPEGESMDFIPGQFVNLEVAPNIRRSYSIASLPSKKKVFSTYANTIAGGPGSKFFETAEPGETVNTLGPLGKFVYEERGRPVYFFATGTGVTPFLSMIRYALEELKTKRWLKLLLGFRHEEDVYPKDILDTLAATHDNFEFELCISKPQGKWEGRIGRITLCIVEIEETDIDAYICGSQGMINDVEQRLLDLGVPSGQIYYEQFY